MEYGSRFKIALCNTESSFHDPKSMVLLYDFCWFQICVRDIPFQPIPCGSLCNLLFADDDFHILAYLKKLVVSTLVYL